MRKPIWAWPALCREKERILMVNFLAQLYWCLLVLPQDSEQLRDALVGAALAGLTQGIPYRLWTLETGALCLALPLDSRDGAKAPHQRASACFHPVAAAVVDRAVLAAAQGHEARIRQLASGRGIAVQDALLLYVSEQPDETILSLKCEDDSPAFDQRVWLVRVVRDEGWAWQVHHLHHGQSGVTAMCPKFAWKDVVPPAPALLSRIPLANALDE
jgi:hypothetical protein